MCIRDRFESTGSLTEPIEDNGCIDQTLTLSIPSDLAAGPNPIFTWTPQSGGAPLVGSSIDVVVSQDEIYIITVTNNCETDIFIGQANITVTEYDGDFIDLDFSSCNGVSIPIGIPEDFDGGENPTYFWKRGTTLLGTTDFDASTDNIDETFELQPAGSGIDELTICVTNDCVQNFEIGNVFINIVDFPSFQIECLTEVDTVSLGQNIELAISPATTGAEYVWSNTNQSGLASSTGVTNTYTGTDPNETGIDGISVTGEFMGCTFTASKSLLIRENLIDLPNIFTPGQNIDNIFRIIGADNEFVNIINLQIYDRWGNRVYDNDNPEQEWDGMINGQPAPSEVYIYTVTYQIAGQDPVTKSSDLTLLR